MTRVLRDRPGFESVEYSAATTENVVDSPEAVEAIDPVVVELTEQLADVQAKNALLEAHIEALSSEHAQALVLARDEGIEAGRSQVTRDEADLLDVFTQGVNQAVAGFENRLETAEELSRTLAGEALDQLLSERRGELDFIGKLISKGIERVGAKSVVRVRVSTEDFETGPELVDLLDERVRPQVEVTRDSDLSSGGFEIDLKLGSVRFSNASVRKEIRSMLIDMEESVEAVR